MTAMAGMTRSGVQAPIHDQRVAADGDHVAVGEVDQPQDAEQQADAERHEGVDAAERERVDEVLEELDHAAVSAGRAASGPNPK